MEADVRRGYGSTQGGAVLRAWNVSLGNARVMRTSGVNALTFTPGTQVVISGNPSASSNDHRMLAQKITRADGFVWMRPPPTP